MKNIRNVLLAATAAVALAACSYVPAGNVGVKVNLLGSSKGVDAEELGVGRYWIGMNEQLFLFPTFMQNYTWTQNPHEGQPEDEFSKHIAAVSMKLLTYSCVIWCVMLL